MYYHNSKTVKQLKSVKQAKATEMKSVITQMKAITFKYQKLIKLLEDMRQKEILADDILSRWPEKQAEVRKQMDHNYLILDNKLKKTIDNL